MTNDLEKMISMSNKTDAKIIQIFSHVDRLHNLMLGLIDEMEKLEKRIKVLEVKKKPNPIPIPDPDPFMKKGI